MRWPEKIIQNRYFPMEKAILTFTVLLVLIVGGFAGLQAGSDGSGYSGSSQTAMSTTGPTNSGGSTTSTTSTGVSTSVVGSQSSTGQLLGAGQIKHVIIILMENEEYGDVIGNPSAPYENQLASQYALAGNYFAVSHPSLPNYFALVAGDTFGVTSDCSPVQCALPVKTIANLLDAGGLSWKEYAESMTSNCSQSDSQDGLYVTRHVPFVYFEGITGNSGSGETSDYCDAHVVPFTQFSNDLASSDLPSYSFITPNICDDAHSCPLSTGDAWLSTVVPGIVGSSSFSSTALFITYDEGEHRCRVRPELRRTGALHPRLSLRQTRVRLAGAIFALLPPRDRRSDIRNRESRKERRDGERDVRHVLVLCARRELTSDRFGREHLAARGRMIQPVMALCAEQATRWERMKKR
jgi:hypothetical protein